MTGQNVLQCLRNRTGEPSRWKGYLRSPRYDLGRRERRIGPMPIEEHLGKADWKKEKHVPVIECPDAVKADEVFEVRVSIGKEIAHPNTTAHHIRWIALYFHPDGEKFSYQI